MELEFDKEIDAILRRADGTGAAVDAGDAAHLDADTIAAFAENALPQKAKLLYMEHFADCDRCRRLLSHSISFNSEAAVTAASTSSASPATDAVAPWWSSFFKTPEMAMAMGALVLAFSGLLGYLAIQNRTDTAAPEVSQMTENKPVTGGPSFDGEIEMPSANAASNAAMPANTAATNTAAMPPPSAANAEPFSLARRTDAPESATDVVTKEVKPVAATEPAKPLAAPPAPMAGQPTDTVAGVRLADEKLKAEEKDASLLAKAKSTDDRASRDLPPAAKKSGPTRSGPSNAQLSNQTQTQSVFDASSPRSIAGKSFDRRDGVWYDLAYKGQSTKNVRRGSDEYKKLDARLRNIGDTLDGIVVVVWKEKAYRLQ